MPADLRAPLEQLIETLRVRVDEHKQKEAHADLRGLPVLAARLNGAHKALAIVTDEIAALLAILAAEETPPAEKGGA